MPSTTQLVPQFRHSYVEVYVNDNTEFRDTPATVSDDSLKTIHVFRSPKGPANTLVTLRGVDSLESTFGKGDYKKYGQAFMMPHASLSAGVTVRCMRLMPDDATFANSNLYMYYRVSERVTKTAEVDALGQPVYEEDGVTIKTNITRTPVFQVMFRTSNISPDIVAESNQLKEDGFIGLRSADADDVLTMARKAVKSVPGTDTPTDGGAVPNWNCVYLGSFCAAGPGIYGNNFRWRIVSNTEFERDYNVKLYTYEMLTVENGISKTMAYVGTFGTGVVNDASINVSDVVKSYDFGSYPVEVICNEGALDEVYEEYVSFLHEVAATGLEVTIPSQEEFDPLFGKYINSEDSYEYYQVVTIDDDIYPIADDEGYCDLDAPTGNYFRGGYDGSFSTFIDPATKEKTYGPTMLLTASEVSAAHVAKLNAVEGRTTREALAYMKAFDGRLDRRIRSTWRTPADYLLDGNYPYDAKVAAAQWAIKRWDALMYIDMGLDITSFSTQTFSMIDQLYSGVFDSNVISKNIQSVKVIDPYGKRRVEVTPTYIIAQGLPEHIRQFGIQQAYAKSYARITGIVKESVSPPIDEWEKELMSNLADRRINYIECVGEGVFQRGMQNDSQIKQSDLLEESNMHVLFWLKRNIERDVFDSLYDFSDATDRATFKQVEEAKYEYIIGSLVASFAIRFDMNDWESERQIIHCYVDISYRTISKQGIVEIDINRRNLSLTA